VETLVLIQCGGDETVIELFIHYTFRLFGKQ